MWSHRVFVQPTVVYFSCYLSALKVRRWHIKIFSSPSQASSSEGSGLDPWRAQRWRDILQATVLGDAFAPCRALGLDYSVAVSAGLFHCSCPWSPLLFLPGPPWSMLPCIADSSRWAKHWLWERALRSWSLEFITILQYLLRYWWNTGYKVQTSRFDVDSLTNLF